MEKFRKSYNSDYKLLNKVQKKTLRLILEAYIESPRKNKSKMRSVPSLHCAATSREVMQILLQAAIESDQLDVSELVYQRDSKGSTIIHELAELYRMEELVYLIEELDNVILHTLLMMTDSKGRTALHCSSNHADFTQLLLDNIPEDRRYEYITARDDCDGNTALHVAKHGAVINTLLANMERSVRGRALHITNTREEGTPLHYANNSEVAQVIIETLWDVGLCTDSYISVMNTQGQTVFHIASMYGRKDVIQYLKQIIPYRSLDNLIQLQDNDGNTALHFADFGQMANLLIYGVDLRNRRHFLFMTNIYGHTALHTATNRPLICALVNALPPDLRLEYIISCISGSVPPPFTAKSKYTRKILDSLLQETRELSLSTEASPTDIIESPPSNNFKRAREFVDNHGGNWDTLNRQQKRVITSIFDSESVRGHIRSNSTQHSAESAGGTIKSDITPHPAVDTPTLFRIIIAALKETESDVVEFIHRVDCIGRTLLHRAGFLKQLDIVTQLKDLIDETQLRNLVHISDKQGNTALHVCKDENIANVLLKAVGIKQQMRTYISHENNQGQTALHTASKAGELEVLKLLCKKGNALLLQKKDNSGNTALHYAKYGAIAHLLIKMTPIKEREILVYSRNEEGDTALHTAHNPGCVSAITTSFTLKSRLEEYILLQNTRGETAEEKLRAGGLERVADKVEAELSNSREISELDGSVDRNLYLQTVYTGYKRSHNNAVIKETAIRYLETLGEDCQQNRTQQDRSKYIALKGLGEILCYPGALWDTDMMACPNRAPTLLSADSKEMAIIYLTAVRQVGGDPVEFICRPGANQMTVLHKAVVKNQLDLIEYLTTDIDNEITQRLIPSQDSKGNIALHYATEGTAIRYLLRWHTDELSECTNKAGESVLHTAVKSGDISVIRELVTSLPSQQLNSLLMMTDSEGNTVLHLAVRRSMMNLLLREINQENLSEFVCTSNRRGDTALHVVQNVGCVELLLSSLTDMAVRDEYILVCNKDGDTALHQARWSSIAEALVKGIRPDRRNQLLTHVNERGETAQQAVSRRDRPSVQKYLVRACCSAPQPAGHKVCLPVEGIDHLY